jgi:regulator of protease activity HflC (stomatin/prohibitin superfamily)
VVLRMGKYKGLKGTGLFMIIPIIDSVSAYIDQRVRVNAFKTEQTLTKDTVPVNVDAVVYCAARTSAMDDAHFLRYRL